MSITIFPHQYLLVHQQCHITLLLEKIIQKKCFAGTSNMEYELYIHSRREMLMEG